MRFSFTVPGTPPSVNTYVRHSRGRHFVTKEAEAFKSSVWWTVAEQRPGEWHPDRRFSLGIVCRFKSRRCPDIDNLPKLILDGLQAAGIFDNDNQVDDMRVSRYFGCPDPRTEITIEAL